jgi:hypothetical protein
MSAQRVGAASARSLSVLTHASVVRIVYLVSPHAGSQVRPEDCGHRSAACDL